MRVITFPVTLSREFDSLILGGRAAMADLIRGEAKAAMARADSAGIDPYTAGMRLTQTWAQAVGASKFLRGLPPALARWAMRVDHDARVNGPTGYPEPPAKTVGGYGPRWVQVLPAGGAVMLTAGGVRAIGQTDQAIEARLVQECRLTHTDTGWVATVLVMDHNEPRADHEDPTDDEPVDGDMEREDA
jgi:hypothetical protein